jgi:hypothetical protein
VHADIAGELCLSDEALIQQCAERAADADYLPSPPCWGSI